MKGGEEVALVIGGDDLLTDVSFSAIGEGRRGQRSQRL